MRRLALDAMARADWGAATGECKLDPSSAVIQLCCPLTGAALQADAIRAAYLRLVGVPEISSSAPAPRSVSHQRAEAAFRQSVRGAHTTRIRIIDTTPNGQTASCILLRLLRRFAAAPCPGGRVVRRGDGAVQELQTQCSALERMHSAGIVARMTVT